jgi:hypothetical protein
MNKLSELIILYYKQVLYYLDFNAHIIKSSV